MLLLWRPLGRSGLCGLLNVTLWVQYLTHCLSLQELRYDRCQDRHGSPVPTSRALRSSPNKYLCYPSAKEFAFRAASELDRYAAGKPGDSRCPHFSPPLIDAMFVIRLFSGARSSNPYKLLPVRDGCSVSPLLEFSLLHLDLPGCDCVTMPATPSIEKTSADADIEHNDHTLHDHHERDHGHDVEADPQHLGDEEFGGHEARKKLEKKLLRKLDARMSILIVIYILNYVSSG